MNKPYSMRPMHNLIPPPSLYSIIGVVIVPIV